MATSVCRVCLVRDEIRRTRLIPESMLEVYEKLSNTKVDLEDRKAYKLCFICYWMLQRSKTFSDMAQRSEKILRNVSLKQIYALNIRQIQNWSIKTLEVMSLNGSSKDKSTQIHNNTMAVVTKITSKKKTRKAPEEINENSVHDEKSSEVLGGETIVEAVEEKSSIEAVIEELNPEAVEEESSPEAVEEESSPEAVEEESSTEAVEEESSIDAFKEEINGKLTNEINPLSVANNKLSGESVTVASYCCGVCQKVLPTKNLLENHFKIHSKVVFYPKPDKSKNNSGLIKKSIKKTPTKAKRKKTKTPLNDKKRLKKIRRAPVKLADKNTLKPVKFDRYICDICNKIFTTKGNMKIHIENHMEHNVFLCDVCGRSFTRKHYLKLHKITHSGLKPFACTLCTSTFTINSYLELHMRTHTGEKPFLCDLCDKSFSAQSSLRKHRRIHTGEKPYPCTSCDKSFYCSSDLNRHIKSHSDRKPFTCDLCNKSFKTSKYLKMHRREHTGERLNCKLCCKSYIVKHHLTQHIRNKHS